MSALMQHKNLEVIGFLHRYGVNGLRNARQQNIVLWATPCCSSGDKYGNEAIPLYVANLPDTTNPSIKLEQIGFLSAECLVNLRYAREQNTSPHIAPCHPSSAFSMNATPVYVDASTL